MINGKPGILVIRRDNIGDLACTTPLMAALRTAHPEACLVALVNSYNREVLAGNPRLDAVFSYSKAKHRQSNESLMRIYLERVRAFLALRRLRLDYAILAAPHYQPHALTFARAAGARKVVGFTEQGCEAGIDIAIPYCDGGRLHEVEDVFRLGVPLGVHAGHAPPLEIFPEAKAVEKVRSALRQSHGDGDGPVIAVHISSRKPSQRWPAEQFASVIRELRKILGARFILLWAPGGAANPMHPGDDAVAERLMQSVHGLPVLQWPTISVSELTAALAAVDAVLCSDGGAMHLAAGLGKPIVCLFGDSQASRWHPWGVPYRLLQSTSRQVVDVSVQSVLDSFRDLLCGLQHS
jgi:ADP-heptose:LPS heptosyltransferase